MKLRLVNELLFVAATITYRTDQIVLPDVLVDTGSAGTVFAADKLLQIGVQIAEDDPIHRIQGIGGSEFVFSKRMDMLRVGEFQVPDFTIEIGAMAYNLNLDGIIGLDYLRQVGAVLDLARLEIYSLP